MEHSLLRDRDVFLFEKLLSMTCEHVGFPCPTRVLN